MHPFHFYLILQLIYFSIGTSQNVGNFTVSDTNTNDFMNIGYSVPIHLQIPYTSPTDTILGSIGNISSTFTVHSCSCVLADVQGNNYTYSINCVVSYAPKNNEQNYTFSRIKPRIGIYFNDSTNINFNYSRYTPSEFVDRSEQYSLSWNYTSNVPFKHISGFAFDNGIEVE